ncbi:tetratricopeptide repeat protein [Dechloromonas denitrificans]|nr:tetratricopeptide repeat protein [Dechloromonas denitrificans]
MRQLRPELYSDSTSRTSHRLKPEILSHHLDTITERNQTHDFEIFCRKLCERTICPNLRPATGPEGGGDSKADTETIPVADEIAKLQYIVGQANGGRERWAFAFSAKQKWAEKARSDVEGIVATRRGYHKIFFVTSRAARAKDRARVEDELSREHGLQVTILDRAWIIGEVIDKNRRDLAFNYLAIGEEGTESELGPEDYSRTQQLADIERELDDPTAFEGMAMHLATESLVAAKLSRSLGFPRTDVDGRFLRAVRVADNGGTRRQKLEARYEWLWTVFWWFDDIDAVVAGYDQFEAEVIEDDNAKNLEFLCNLAQLLFNAVFRNSWPREKAQLEARVARLKTRLAQLANEAERPNNALQARTSLLIVRVNEAIVNDATADLSSLWPEFSDVLLKAEGLGEFEGSRLVKMIQVFGEVAGNDSGYRDLVDQASEFVGNRTSEGEGALILLRRAKQLADAEQSMEMIRLLGKAGRRLNKKEYAEQFIETMSLLAIAYRSAGLLWAARAAFTTAVASLFIEGDESGSVPAKVFPTLMVGAWIAVELKHFPEALEAIQIARGCLSSLPFSDESAKAAQERLQDFDGVLACQIINLGETDLEGLRTAPDILEGLGLFVSRAALLYALGHENLLRSDGSIPAEESASDAAKLFQTLADQPAADAVWRPSVLNAGSRQTFSTSVLGVRVDVVHDTTDASITLAEAAVGVIEALFATAYEIEAAAHIERFSARIVEADVARYEVSIDADQTGLTVQWPRGLLPRPASSYDDYHDMLLEVASAVLSSTCHIINPKAALPRLFENDAAIDRVAMVGSVCLGRARIFGGVSRLAAWDRHSPERYDVLPSRPRILRSVTAMRRGESQKDDEEGALARPAVHDHRDMRVRSVIDVHLWDRANWIGAAFGDLGPHAPPWFGLMFTHGDAGTRIFERWRERFGDVDEDEEIYISIVRKFSEEHPKHYGLIVTSKVHDDERLSMVASRTNIMHPSDDVNLSRFLAAYRQSGAYLLMPAIYSGSGAPSFLRDLALMKRALSVKDAVDITAADIESAHLKLFRS